MRNSIVIVLVFLFMATFNVANARVKPDNENKAGVLFNKLKTLAGVWVKQGDFAADNEGKKTPKFSIAFELTANDTVLVETWIYKGKKHSLTIYHQDGDRLIATHYCPQGNQPRLKLSGRSSLNDISFDYLDATNLASLEDSHQHSLGFEFSDSAQTIKRKESYLSKAGEEFSEMVLVRK